ncbi:XdhC family protein (plasmid) [Agrobacterium tumefaciens]|uniref:XdhC family protein n=1 Tax=Agrobacterium tumefaciens TaxID=358 RepID=UPI001F2C3941|nr:XdhC family protein [Agrobacterium tumefaciens]WQE43340.1 XdhC family protein [Agrobacterium tumefaciens]
MNVMMDTKEMPVLRRSSTTDDPLDILEFAIASFRRGGAALATLVEIRGGAARALGAHVAVAANGSFCGYVSGGCVEAAVASEAILAMAEGRDRTVVYGDGSPFFDIVLPCGGGITVAIHVLRDVKALEGVINEVRHRRPVALRYCPNSQTVACIEPPSRARWMCGRFETVYRPRTRIVVSGHGAEALVVARIAEAAGHDVTVLGNGETCDGGHPVIDPFTAVLLLHHDLDTEGRILEYALHSNAFYIGALGSTRTHQKRVECLRHAGFSKAEIDRIKAPIGLFGPTRDTTSLAFSVLADVAASRLTTYA